MNLYFIIRNTKVDYHNQNNYNYLPINIKKQLPRKDRVLIEDAFMPACCAVIGTRYLPWTVLLHRQHVHFVQEMCSLESCRFRTVDR